MHDPVGWAIRAFYARLRRAMGAGTIFPDGENSRAPCPRCHNSQLRKNAWARRTRGFDRWKCGANAFATLRFLRLMVLAKRNQCAVSTHMRQPLGSCQRAQRLLLIVRP